MVLTIRKEQMAALADATPSNPKRPAGVPVQPCPLAAKHWIEIVLRGEDGRPIPGEAYTVTPPSGAVRTGRLDAQGRARLEGLPFGPCHVSFPDLDQDAWTDEQTPK